MVSRWYCCQAWRHDPKVEKHHVYVNAARLEETVIQTVLTNLYDEGRLATLRAEFARARQAQLKDREKELKKFTREINARDQKIKNLPGPYRKLVRHKNRRLRR